MSLDLTPRCRELLRQIINAQGNTSVGELATQLRVSRRTVYYDLERVNRWLSQRGIAPLQTLAGGGFSVDTATVLRLRQEVSDEILLGCDILTPEQRRALIICAITVRDHPMLIADFMDLCQVSRNTTVADLKDVSDYLTSIGLSLVYLAKQGYRIRGDNVKRRAIFFMLAPELRCVTSGVIGIGNPEAAKEIMPILTKIEHELGVEYAQDVLSVLAIFMSTIGVRDNLLDLAGIDLDEIMATQEYQLTAQYFPDLVDTEKIYVSLHLLGSRLQTVPVDVTPPDERSYELARGLVARFCDIACMQFDREDELTEAIQNHLRTSLYRYRFGIQLGNPLLDEITSEYSEIFQLTKKSCDYLVQELECPISDAEIAYLTLHFGSFLTLSCGSEKNLRIAIICPNGIGTGFMLRNEVSRLMPRSQIENIPLSSYRPDHGYDVIVSTVTITNEENLIVVHPILTDQDRVAILSRCASVEPVAQNRVDDIVKIASKYLDAEQQRHFAQDLTRYFSSSRMLVPTSAFGDGLLGYLDDTHLQVCHESMGWAQALRLSCQPLVDSGSVDPSYVEAILADQTNRGLAMFLADSLVLAHSGTQFGVHRLDVALTVFAQPVVFPNDRQARIIIALAAEDQTKHIRVLNDILTVFSKQKAIQSIARGETRDEVLALLQGFLADGAADELATGDEN